MMTLSHTELEEEVDIKELLENDRQIILFNDDVNTFDFVIDTLMKVCDHSALQAEQCSYIVHYNGKCEVKKGSYTELKPMCSTLLEKGLTAEIQ